MGNSSSTDWMGGAFLIISALFQNLFKQPAHANETMQELEKLQAELEEARQREAASSSREAAAKIRAEAALGEAKEARQELQRGIRPILMPTKEQVEAAKERIQYNPGKLHFAVCGTSGSGKSSLINAFRGLAGKEGGAAAVGVTETTSEVTRYPDRGVLPYSRVVWYDIPGAGTPNVPDWQYFNDQGLFVFDFVVMVYDVRFTTIDIGIIENGFRFNKSVFIVRSKADQHIRNMTDEEEVECLNGDDVDYQTIRTKFIEATRSNFYIHMQKMSANPTADERARQLILNQRVYIVSAKNVLALMRNGRAWPSKALDRKTFIDEELLVQDMLRTAVKQRYTTTTACAGEPL